MRNKLLKNSLHFLPNDTLHTLNPYLMLHTKYFFQNLDKFKTWHDRLGHPRIGMIRKIISNYVGHNLSVKRFSTSSDLFAPHVLLVN
jgi:hypothetical protein